VPLMWVFCWPSLIPAWVSVSPTHKADWNEAY
jgi:hypothetical protein